jgi:cellulose synthase/poly-beta-1,6-N-acetylglucosamine synthase-like glycosyltransferase
MSTFTPTVSVVIGVYNGADMIGDCLESLLNQNYPRDAYDIIVVENGSTDNTAEVVTRYPVRFFQNEVRGLAPARNLGLAKSEADIVLTTDADCIAHPDCLAELVKPYADPQVGGVGGAILSYDGGNRSVVEMFSDECTPLVNFSSGENEFLPRLCGAHASYRRQLLNEVGGFNPNMLTGEDVDISWRIQLETGVKLVYAPKSIIYHHHLSSQAGLARLYRHYGFGEILLDTMYGKYPGYPRDLSFQMRRILGQIAALPRYALSMAVRQVRLTTGRATPYEAAVPRLWFLIESNNIRGKIEGLIMTRFMRDAQPILEMDRATLIERLYGGRRG